MQLNCGIISLSDNALLCSSDAKKFKRNLFDLIMRKFTPTITILARDGPTAGRRFFLGLLGQIKLLKAFV